MIIIIDIWKYKIYKYLDLKSLLRIKFSYSELYKNLDVIDLLNIDRKYKPYITSKILKQYPNIRYLHVDYRTKIQNIDLEPLNLNKIRCIQ